MYKYLQKMGFDKKRALTKNNEVIASRPHNLTKETQGVS